MTDMKNGDFPSGYPEFEIPRTPGKRLSNLLEACVAGVFMDEVIFSSEYVKNLLGAKVQKDSLYPDENINIYDFDAFEFDGDIKKYIMNIDFEYKFNKQKIYIKASISEHVRTDDILFENFLKSNKLKWNEKEACMTMEAMAIWNRTTHPYGFRSFESSFEFDDFSHTIIVSTRETGHIRNMVIVSTMKDKTR